MNKTVNMNLGGLFFHIDEDAYQKLNRYFDAIRRSLSNDGRDEIMNDIESRVSELFSEKISNGKQVIGITDVDNIITVMGQPEDYKIENNEPLQASRSFSNISKTKKLYRDKDGGMIGGVLSGFGHYFGIETIWLRLIMLVLLFTFGTGILLYIIFWIVMPEAVTTSEKLEMRGEPINISNIEKKVKEEFDTISEKFKNADYDKMGNQVRHGAEKVGTALETTLPKIVDIFGKILGSFILLFAGMTLIGVCIGSIVMIIFSTMPDNFITQHVQSPLGFETPIWLQGFLFLIAFGIPFFFLLLLGLKLLVKNLRSLGSTLKYTLLGLWIVSILVLIALGIKKSAESAFDGRVSEKQTITINPNDTLQIKFKYNDLYAKSFENKNHEFIQDADNKNLIYSNNITFEILESNESIPYIQIEKLSEGSSLSDAKQRSEKIKYNYRIDENELILDNYLLTDAENDWREQEVKIYLYLPKGIVFKTDSSVAEYDDSDSDYFNSNDNSDNAIYKVESKTIKCLNCPSDENENNFDDEFDIDLNDENINVTINKDGVKIEKDSVITNSDDIKELKISKDGIIIKTK